MLSCRLVKNPRGFWFYRDALITKSTISHNTVYTEGPGSGSYNYSRVGGIYVEGSVKLKNSIISYNSSTIGGGHKTNIGGGIYFYSDTTTIINCTIVYNTNDGIKNDNGSLKIINSIIWGNSSSQVNGSAIITYSDVDGGFIGEGNIN